MPDKIFPKGINIRKPSENAPDFIKSNIGIHLGDFIAWAEQYTDVKGWINLDLKLSKEGKQYLELNQYKRNTTPTKSAQDEIESEELPF